MKTSLVLLSALIIMIIFDSANGRESSDLACRYLKNFNVSIDKMKKNPRIWMRGDDSCVMEIFDLLTVNYIKKREEKYLIVLDTISKYTDGCISEALTFNVGEIFQKRPLEFIRYLENNKPESGLKEFLVFYLYDEYSIDFGSNNDKNLTRMKNDLSRLAKRLHLTREETLFLESVEEEMKELIKDSQ